jgi:hypothetical protein
MCLSEHAQVEQYRAKMAAKESESLVVSTSPSKIAARKLFGSREDPPRASAGEMIHAV